MIPVVVNGVNRISSFRGTSQKVDEAEAGLEQLKKENESLKKEFEYKNSDRFAEEEIRNKLGMAKPGETEVIIPKPEGQSSGQSDQGPQVPNWQKWRNLFLGKS
jgi:cell division protein FtsB